jgi:very-short-patch-repair endonuclease
MWIDSVLRRQAGTISREQALAAGLSGRQVDRRLATGRWLLVHPRVYLTADRVRTDEARVWAASLWAGAAGTVSGLAAAWWHGLVARCPPIVEITVPVHRRPRAGPGLRVRRRELAASDRVGVRGLWLTDLPLTVLEAAVALGADGPTLLDRALQRRVGFAALHRAHCRNLGRHGATAAGGLLTAAADRAASAAERRLIAVLRAAGLTGWRPNHRFGGHELDLAFIDHRVAVEVDGWAWHHDARTFGLDRRRQNSLVLAGWTVLRFTWQDLTVRPDEVVAEIRVALAANLTHGERRVG